MTYAGGGYKVPLPRPYPAAFRLRSLHRLEAGNIRSPVIPLDPPLSPTPTPGAFGSLTPFKYATIVYNAPEPTRGS